MFDWSTSTSTSAKSLKQIKVYGVFSELASCRSPTLYWGVQCVCLHFGLNVVTLASKVTYFRAEQTNTKLTAIPHSDLCTI